MTDEEIFRNFRFNLINPGARSLALGGAFISLADDASAAQANPAGLAFLRRWELFFETRAVDNAAIATTQSVQGSSVNVGTDIDDVVSPTFVSGVFNFERWALGVSRQEVLNIRNDTLSGYVFTFADNPAVLQVEGQGQIDVDIVNYNVSTGFRLGTNWGIGATVTYSELDVQSRVTNLIVNVDGVVAGMPVLLPTVDLATRISDSDDDLAFSVGAIYKRTGRWQVGAVYRKAPNLAVQQQIGLDPAELDTFDVAATIGDQAQNRFSLPDSLGIGGSVLLMDQQLTLAADVERIFYSDLTEGFIAGVNVLTSFDARFDIDDATDVRAGAEYIFAPKGKRPPLALRGGVFLESDATIFARFTGSGAFGQEDIFRKGDDQLHGTVGLGVALSRYKLDFAADFSETDNEYVVSFILQGK